MASRSDGTRTDLRAAMQRAFDVAGAEPTGPVYVTLPKDVLEQPHEGSSGGTRARTGTPRAGVRFCAPGPRRAMADRSREAVDSVGLCGPQSGSCRRADPGPRLSRPPVVETRHVSTSLRVIRCICGFCAFPHAAEADCILILVTTCRGFRARTTRLRLPRLQMDIDPQKRDMPFWDSRWICRSTPTRARPCQF